MAYTETISEELHKAYKVEVEGNVINDEMQKKLQSISKHVKIPGFRPGKIPLKVLEQKYSKEVLDEVIEESIRRTNKEIVDKHSYKLAMAPTVKVTKYTDGGNLEYELALDLFPEIPALDFAKITLERLQVETADKDLDEELKNVAKSMRRAEKIKETRKTKKGDILVISFIGRKDGVPFDGGKADNFNIEIGSGQLIPGFEDNLIGLDEGEEKTFPVKFPDNYGAKELAGQNAEFTVTVKEIREAMIPELNDDFVQKLGIENLDKLREIIKAQIGDKFTKIARIKLKRDLFDKLDKELTFKLPERMVNIEFDSIWKKVEQSKQNGNPDLDKPEEELKKEYRKIAERRVKLGLFLTETGRLNNINLTQQDVQQAVMQMAQMFPGEEMKIIDYYGKNPAKIEELKGPILEDKTVDFVLDKITLKDKKVSAEEMKEITSKAEEGAVSLLEDDLDL